MEVLLRLEGPTWVSRHPPDLRRRGAIAWLFSLALHAVLVSLHFGVAGLGLPTLATDRPAPPAELTVRLAEAPPPPPRTRAVIVEPRRAPGTQVDLVPRTQVDTPRPERAPRVRAKPSPELLALAQPREPAFPVPPAAPEREQPEPQADRERVEEPVPSREEEERKRAVQALEATRLEEEKAQRDAQLVEAQRRQEEQRRALALEREKQEERRRLEQAAREEEARKQEQARRLEEDTQREEQTRLQQLEEQRRIEAQKLAEAQRRIEAERLAEAERRAAEQREAQRRAEQQRQQAAEVQRRLEAERLAEAQRRAEEQRRADEQREAQRRAEQQRQAEATQQKALQAKREEPVRPSAADLATRARELARAPGSPAPAPSLAPVEERRRPVLFRDPDVGLRLYVEGWRSKVERNSALNFPSAARRAHDAPVVSVYVRRDGSVEDVVIQRSSGVRDLDEAVRRMVALYAPYATFPPELSRRFESIEIRRAWFFRAGVLTIGEEMR